MGIDAHRKLPDGRTLSDVMEFEHVIMVNANGTITEDLPNERAYWAPEVTWQNGTHDVQGDGWELMNGYSGQQSYSGPVMHPSEFIGGRMADDILSTPGLYVAVVVSDDEECQAYCPEDCDGEHEPAGWAVARKDIPHADYPHEPGRLYDCAACEAECHCKPGETECVYSGEHS